MRAHVQRGIGVGGQPPPILTHPHAPGTARKPPNQPAAGQPQRGSQPRRRTTETTRFAPARRPTRIPGLACHTVATRPPQSICAGHRPRTSASVRRNPGRLLYFRAVRSRASTHASRAGKAPGRRTLDIAPDCTGQPPKIAVAHGPYSSTGYAGDLHKDLGRLTGLSSWRWRGMRACSPCLSRSPAAAGGSSFAAKDQDPLQLAAPWPHPRCRGARGRRLESRAPQVPRSRSTSANASDNAMSHEIPPVGVTNGHSLNGASCHPAQGEGTSGRRPCDLSEAGSGTSPNSGRASVAARSLLAAGERAWD